jgi:hypothetical protein
MFRSLGRVFDAIFGDRVRKIDEMINVFLFKIASAVEFIGIMMEPVLRWFEKLIREIGPPIVDFLKNVFLGALSSAKAFIEGFKSTIGPVETSFKNIIEHVRDFVEALFKPNKNGDTIQDVFRIIGETLGSMVGWVTTMVEKFTSGFLPAISNIATPLKEIMEAFQDIWLSIFGSDEKLKTWGTLFENLGRILGEGIMEALGSIADAFEDVALLAKWIGGEMTWREFNAERKRLKAQRREERNPTPDTSSAPESPGSVLGTSYSFGGNTTGDINVNVTVSSPEDVEPAVAGATNGAVYMRSEILMERTRLGKR